VVPEPSAYLTEDGYPVPASDSLILHMLSRLALRKANLFGCSLASADLEASNFDGASLVAATLLASKLEFASFRGASLEYAVLERARLDSADFRNARLDFSHFDPEAIRRAKLDQRFEPEPPLISSSRRSKSSPG